jgi:DNA-binding NtrC family response regulator
VRIVAATNRDLAGAVTQGTFRQDLLFRLNAIEIRVPSLRERSEDIEPIVEAFLARTGTSAQVTPRAMAALAAYPWPGNVRELEHHVQRLAALGVKKIDLQHLPRALRTRSTPIASASPTSASDVGASNRPNADDAREAILGALGRSSGNISHAARELGLTRHGLKKRMVRLGLRAAKLETGEKER